MIRVLLEMAITEVRPTAAECPCTNSIQRIHKRPAYSSGTHRFVYAHDLTVTTQSRDFAPIDETLTSVLVGHHKPAPRESDKDASQPLPPAKL